MHRAALLALAVLPACRATSVWPHEKFFIGPWLVGGSSPYERYLHGQSETWLQEDLVRVTFSGKGLPSQPQECSDFCLLYCAELALDTGRSHFALLDDFEGANVAPNTDHMRLSVRVAEMHDGPELRHAYLLPGERGDLIEVDYLQRSLCQDYRLGWSLQDFRERLERQNRICAELAKTLAEIEAQREIDRAKGSTERRRKRKLNQNG